MKFFIIIFLFEFSESKYEIIDLKFDNPLYYIPLKICEILTETYYFLLSSNLPISFYPTMKCKICTKLKINKTKLNLISIQENIKIPYYHNNYTGTIYTHKLSINNLPYFNNQSKFIGFDQVSYKSSFPFNGIFSLSYLNYNFNTTEKIFAFQFIKDNCQLHLGGFDESLIKYNESIKSFKIVKGNKNSNNSFYNPIWYIKFNSIYINDSPYDFNNNIKLTFDIGSDKLHLPKKFFFDNMNKLFPEKSHCQIDPSGFFKCNCDDNFRNTFGNITFYNNKDEFFTIYPVDYIIYETGITGSQCITKIKINYENDLFIAGNIVLKNYYSIFNVDSESFAAYRKEEGNIDNIFYFILTLIIICVLVVLMFGIYFFRKKCKRNNNIRYNENEENQENDQEEENDFLDDDDNMDNIQEPINPGQGESSEDTE